HECRSAARRRSAPQCEARRFSDDSRPAARRHSHRSAKHGGYRMSAPANVIRRASAGTTESKWVRRTLITVALLFMLLFLVLPLAAVAAEALRKGFGAYLEALQEPDAWSAIRLTLLT